MVRILVTGGSGFIGRQVVAALLARKQNVIVIGRGSRPDHLPDCVTWHKLDLLDPSRGASESIATLQADHLIHLAWETSHGKFWHHPSNFEWVSASTRLLRAFHEAGGDRVTAIGSAMEYAAPDVGPCDEYDTPISDVSAYATAKGAFRRVGQNHAESTGSSFVWARVFPAYGENENRNRLIPTVALALLANREAHCSPGRQIRDFMDVRDHGAAIATLALSSVEGIVNIGSGKPISNCNSCAQFRRGDRKHRLWQTHFDQRDCSDFGPTHRTVKLDKARRAARKRQ